MYENKAKKNKNTLELHLPLNNFEPTDDNEVRDISENFDNLKNVNEGSANQFGILSELNIQPRRKFKAPYKQITKGKGTACELDDCSFCATKSDCGQCVFDLNKAKL